MTAHVTQSYNIYVPALAKNIEDGRKARGWTRVQLAERMGVSRVAVLMWETGKYQPKIAKLKRLARFYRCSVDDLLRAARTA